MDEETHAPAALASINPDHLPDLVLPQPTQAARIMSGLKTIGVLLGGVGLLFIGLTGNSSPESAADVKCRANIEDRLTQLQAQINGVGWSAMLAAFEEDQVAVDAQARIMRELIEGLPSALDRADRRFDICRG